MTITVSFALTHGVRLAVPLGQYIAAVEPGTLLEPARAPLVGPGDVPLGDVAVGRDAETGRVEVVVQSGDMDTFAGLRMNGLLTISDGEEIDHDEITWIDDLAGRYRTFGPPATIGVRPGLEHVAEWYLGGSPDPSVIPAEHLHEARRPGPLPDHKETRSTGSMRMSWARCAAFTVILMRLAAGLEISEEQARLLDEWIRYQWLRAVHAYRRADGYAPFRAKDWPAVRIGFGYGAAGGFSDTYSGTDFRGRPTWHDSSKNRDRPYASPSEYEPDDEQHLAAEQPAMIAMLTDSWAAAEHAQAMMEANQSRAFPAKPWESIRAYGWTHKGLAIVQACCPERDLAHFGDYANHLLAKMQERTIERGNLLVPVASNGTSHIKLVSGSPFENALVMFEIPEDERQQFVRDCSAFMAGIAIDGIDAVLSLMPNGTEVRRIYHGMLDRCAHFLLINCRETRPDYRSLELVDPKAEGQSGFHDDVAISGVCRPSGTESMVGVFGGGVVPACETIAAHAERRLAEGVEDPARRARLERWRDRAHAGADFIVDGCKARNYFGSGPEKGYPARALGPWLRTTARRGWEG